MHHTRPPTNPVLIIASLPAQVKGERDKASADLIKWKEEALLSRKETEISAKATDVRLRSNRVHTEDATKRLQTAERSLVEARTEIQILKDAIKAMRAETERKRGVGRGGVAGVGAAGPRGPARKGARGGDAPDMWDAHLGVGAQGVAMESREREREEELAAMMAGGGGLPSHRTRPVGGAIRLAPVGAGHGDESEDGTPRGGYGRSNSGDSGRSGALGAHPLYEDGYDPEPSLIKFTSGGNNHHSDTHGMDASSVHPSLGFKIAPPGPGYLQGPEGGQLGGAGRSPLPPLPDHAGSHAPPHVYGAGGLSAVGAVDPHLQFHLLQQQQLMLMQQQQQILRGNPQLASAMPVGHVDLDTDPAHQLASVSSRSLGGDPSLAQLGLGLDRQNSALSDVSESGRESHGIPADLSRAGGSFRLSTSIDPSAMDAALNEHQLGQLSHSGLETTPSPHVTSHVPPSLPYPMSTTTPRESESPSPGGYQSSGFRSPSTGFPGGMSDIATPGTFPPPPGPGMDIPVVDMYGGESRDGSPGSGGGTRRSLLSDPLLQVADSTLGEDDIPSGQEGGLGDAEEQAGVSGDHPPGPGEERIGAAAEAYYQDEGFEE